MKGQIIRITWAFERCQQLSFGDAKGEVISFLEGERRRRRKRADCRSLNRRSWQEWVSHWDGARIWAFPIFHLIIHHPERIVKGVLWRIHRRHMSMHRWTYTDQGFRNTCYNSLGIANQDMFAGQLMEIPIRALAWQWRHADHVAVTIRSHYGTTVAWAQNIDVVCPLIDGNEW